MDLKLCASFSNIDKPAFYESILALLTFVPDFVEITDSINNEKILYSQFSLDMLNEYEENPRIDLYKDDQQVSICNTAYEDGPECVYFRLNNSEKLIAIGEKLSCLPGFTCAHIYDNDFVIWQGEKFISNFEAFKKSYKHLPTINDPVFNRKVIDISKNPGRRILVSKMWLHASWVMIYGAGFFSYFPKNLLLSYKDALEVKELKGGAVMITLYEDPARSEDKSSLKAMQKFIDFIDFNALKERLA